jgi:fermentation-respiration switch protein FrsA (DUF1100 family)
MTSLEVEFNSEGDTVRGDLFLPEGDGPFPVIVMAGGWCYVKELRQPDYAKRFVERGMAALIFDYRRFGASDGEPRQHLDPWDQIADYRNAISFVETRSELDADRVGVWGISYSGGHALILGAIDPRVKAVVSNVPVVDGYQTMWRVHGTERFRTLRQMILEERRKRFQTGTYEYIAMSGKTSDVFATWPLDEVRVVFEELQRTTSPRHEHRSTVASVDLLLNYSVFPYLPRLVDTPTLMITAEGDDITMADLETEAFRQIATPKKKFVVLPSTSHMTLYSNLSALDVAAVAATDWFATYVLNPPSLATVLNAPATT